MRKAALVAVVCLLACEPVLASVASAAQAGEESVGTGSALPADNGERGKGLLAGVSKWLHGSEGEGGVDADALRSTVPPLLQSVLDHAHSVPLLQAFVDAKQQLLAKFDIPRVLAEGAEQDMALAEFAFSQRAEVSNDAARTAFGCNGNKVEISCQGTNKLAIVNATLESDMATDVCAVSRTHGRGGCFVDVTGRIADLCHDQTSCSFRVAPVDLLRPVVCADDPMNLRVVVACKWTTSVAQEAMPRLLDVFWSWGDPFFYSACAAPAWLLYTLSSVFLAGFLVNWLVFELDVQKAGVPVPDNIRRLGTAAVATTALYAVVVTVCGAMSMGSRNSSTVPLYRARLAWTWFVVFATAYMVSLTQRPYLGGVHANVLVRGPTIVEGDLPGLGLGDEASHEAVNSLWSKLAPAMVPAKGASLSSVSIRRRVFPPPQQGEDMGEYSQQERYEAATKAVEWAREALRDHITTSEFPEPKVGAIFETEEAVVDAKQAIMLSWLRGRGEIEITRHPDAAQVVPPRALKKVGVEAVQANLKRVTSSRNQTKATSVALSGMALTLVATGLLIMMA